MAADDIYYRYRFKVSEKNDTKQYYICDSNEKAALKHLWEAFSENTQKKVTSVMLEEIVKVKVYEMNWMDEWISELEHLDKYTYEDYLKLLNLSRLRDATEQKLILQKNSSQLSRLQAVGLLSIDFTIGKLHAIHPSWMAKHYPGLCTGEVIMSVDKCPDGDDYQLGAKNIINQAFKIK